MEKFLSLRNRFLKPTTNYSTVTHSFMVGGHLIYVLIQKLQFQKINFLQNLNTLNLNFLILDNLTTKNRYYEVYS